MGGRKSYSITKVVGSTKKLQRERRELRLSLKIGKPKDVVTATVNIIKNSDVAVQNLTRAVHFFSIIQEFEKRPSSENLKQEVVKRWTELKKEKNIESDSTTDRLLVESAIKTLERRGK